MQSERKRRHTTRSLCLQKMKPQGKRTSCFDGNSMKGKNFEFSKQKATKCDNRTLLIIILLTGCNIRILLLLIHQRTKKDVRRNLKEKHTASSPSSVSSSLFLLTDTQNQLFSDHYAPENRWEALQHPKRKQSKKEKTC